MADEVEQLVRGGGSATGSGDWSRTLDQLFEMPRKKVLLAALGLLLLIALLDGMTQLALSLGILYLFPVILGAVALRRWQMVLLAMACAVLREHFGPWQWEALSISRLLSSFVTFAGAGLLLNEIARNRRQQNRHYREMTEEIARRQEAEGQLRTLVDSSPAAIITLDADGHVILANQAAHEMLQVPVGELPGHSIREYLPTLADLQAAGGALPYRTATNSRGRRANGEYFLACVWFATYQTRNGQHLAAIITDSSEDLRDFQETSLESLLKSTRVLVGSVSHEIRNVCAAIAVVHANLGRIAGVAETEDYTALGTLAQGLARLATVELQSAGESEKCAVNLGSLLEELRIVLEPTLEGESIELEMRDDHELPMVSGDHHSLLQVFLNLARNSVRAMEESVHRRITITPALEDDAVVVRFSDTGRGVTQPTKLFQPFQQGADAVGLGLFVSRALVRASGGELYHEPTPIGCTMCVRLKVSPHHQYFGEANPSEIHA